MTRDSRLYFIAALGLLLVLVQFDVACALQLQDATYTVKEAPLFGLNYKYAMFEAQYDEELYLMRQQTCGCVNDTNIPCPLLSSKTAPVVNENIFTPSGSPITITALQENVWYNSSIMNTVDAEYLKFTVPYNPAVPCPMITFEFQNEVGTLTAFISARFIPSVAAYDFVRSFYSISTTTICPSAQYMYYGTYYVLMSNQAGRSANIYAVKYSISQAPSCPLPPAFDYTSLPPPNVTLYKPQTWLQDGVLTQFYTNPVAPPAGGHLYYKLYAEGRCSHFSVNLMKWSASEGEPYLFATPNYPNPNVQAPSTVKWSSVKTPGDDAIDVYYCNPDPAATYNIFYIGIFVGPGRGGTHQLVATTQHYAPNFPLSGFSWSQYHQDLGFGAAPTLVCPNAVHQCSFFSFKGCDLLNVGCCLYFAQVAPSEHTQAMWPWNAGDESIGQFHLGIQWTDMQPLVPGKMAWSLLMEYSDLDTRHVITTVDPGQCNVTLASMFVNAAGTPLGEQVISFRPKVTECDYEQFLQITDKMDQLTASFRTAQDNINELALQQLRLVIETWKDVYQACSNRMADFANITRTYSQDPAYICTKSPLDPLWAADPCCNPALRDTLSCRPTLVQRQLPISGIADKAAVKNTCTNTECTTSAIQTWVDQTRHAQDTSRGCLPAFTEQASIARSEELLLFTYSCKIQVESADMMGAPCSSDANCLDGAHCNMSTRRCMHDVDDVLRCFANSVSYDVALNLFSLWGYTQKPDNVSLFNAFQDRWVSNLCNGPRANEYRTGFHLAQIEPYCRDSCFYKALEPYCVDASKSRSTTCPIASVCDSSVSTAACFRYFTPTFDDPTGCLASKICNWRVNDTYPCEQGLMNSASCQANCVTGSPNVCMDCSKAVYGTCLEVPAITDQTRCSQGLCTANATVTDPVECAQQGKCSALCPGCDETACTATGTCSDYTEFKALADLGHTGVCLKPRLWTGSGYSCATSPGYTLGTWACANLNPAFTQASCLGTPKAFWYTFANDSSTCTSNAGYGCYSTTTRAFLSRNQTECAICTTCVWKTHYTWAQGVWTPGYIQPLVWDARKHYTPTWLAPAVDYSRVTKDIEAAITRDFSYAYYTDSLCRYDSTNDLIKTTVCDCDAKGSECFANRDQADIGATRACPFQAQTFGTAVVALSLSENAVPQASGCSDIAIQSTSVGKYQVPPDQSVTHALFKKVESNPYLIVVNSKQAIVGQLISDAATITFSFTPQDPINICILTEDFISIEKTATLFTLAKLQKDHSIEVYPGAIEMTMAQAYQQAADSNSSRVQVCGNIVESGTFFAVAVVPNYRKVDPRPSAETIAAACIYFVLMAFAVAQAILILTDYKRQKLLGFKLVALFVVVLNACVRVVYIIPPKNAFKKGSESVQFIIFELPTFLYFSVFTVIVYLWILVVMSTHHFGKRSAIRTQKRLIRNVFILTNVFMYFIFVVFIYLIAILPSRTKPSPCFLGSLDSAVTSVEKSIKIAYWIFQLVVSVILGVGFLVAAIGLLRIVLQLGKRDLGRKEKTSPNKKSNAANIQMVIITVVAFVCVIFLLVRSCVFLDVAVNGTTLHVIVFCMLEIVPQAMLVFYLHPFRCFREAGRNSTSTRSGTSGTIGGRTTNSTAPSTAPSHVEEEPEEDGIQSDATSSDDEDDSDNSDVKLEKRGK